MRSPTSMVASRRGRQPGCQPAQPNRSANLICKAAGHVGPPSAQSRALDTYARHALTMTSADKSTASAMHSTTGTGAHEAHGHYHPDVSAGWLRPAVISPIDSLVTNVALISCVR